MDKLIDDVARTFAGPMARRQTFKLLGGALAALFIGASGADAQAPPCSPSENEQARARCGTDRDSSLCCPPGTCCATRGRTAACCTQGQCVCSNGTCAASTGGGCGRGCHRC